MFKSPPDVAATGVRKAVSSGRSFTSDKPTRAVAGFAGGLGAGPLPETASSFFGLDSAVAKLSHSPKSAGSVSGSIFSTSALGTIGHPPPWHRLRLCTYESQAHPAGLRHFPLVLFPTSRPRQLLAQTASAFQLSAQTLRDEPCLWSGFCASIPRYSRHWAEGAAGSAALPHPFPGKHQCTCEFHHCPAVRSCSYPPTPPAPH